MSRKLSPLVAAGFFLLLTISLPEGASAATVNSITVTTDRADYVNAPGFNVVTATAVVTFNGNFAQMDPVRFDWFDPGGFVPFRTEYRRSVFVQTQVSEAQASWTATREGIGFCVHASINETVGAPPVFTSIACFNVLNRNAVVIVTDLVVTTNPVYENGTLASARADLTFGGNQSFLGDVRFDWYYPNGSLANTTTYPSATQGFAWSNVTVDLAGTGHRVDATYVDQGVSNDTTFDVVDQRVAFWITGDFTGTTILLASGGPYGICGNYTITNGSQLIIEPGTVIRFCRDTGLTVNGTLTVDALASAKVYFLSYELQMQRGDWKGITFLPWASPSSLLSNAVVQAVRAGVTATGVPVTIVNSTIALASGAGIALASSPSLIGGTQVFASDTGIRIDRSRGVVLDGNVVTGCRVGIDALDSDVHLVENSVGLNGDAGLLATRTEVFVEGGSFAGNANVGVHLVNVDTVTLGGIVVTGGNDSLRAEDSRGIRVVLSTLSGSRFRSLFLINATAIVENSTMLGLGWDITLLASQATLVNTTFVALYKPLVSSTLVVMNFLHVLVESNLVSRPRIGGAFVNVSSDGTPLPAVRTGPDGWRMWVLLTHRIVESTRDRFVPNSVDVEVPGFNVVAAPRDVNMTGSRLERFLAVPGGGPSIDVGIDPLVLLLAAAVLTAALLAMPIVRRKRRGNGKPRPPPAQVRLERGVAYLVDEEKADRAFQILASQIAHGAKALAITRLYPEEVRRRYRLTSLPILWLSRGYGKETANPTNLGALVQEVERFSSGKEDVAILLDGLEYLLVQNDPQKVVKFVQTLVDTVSVHHAKLLVPFNTKAVEDTLRAALVRDLEAL